MGNGILNKFIGCCQKGKTIPNQDIDIEKNSLKNNCFTHYKINKLNNHNKTEGEIHNKNEQKIVVTKSKQSTGSGSIMKMKQLYCGDNNSIKDPNISVCNNTFNINNSNFIKNNIIQKNLAQNNLCKKTNNTTADFRSSKKIINEFKKTLKEIKTKLVLSGILFSNDIIEIDKFGIKNGLRKSKDDLTIFGIKANENDDDNESNNDSNIIQNDNQCDYFLNLEKIVGNNNKDPEIQGNVFAIYINKANNKYYLNFLHNSLILYYKITNTVFFDLDKDYYLILGDIFLTIQVRKIFEEKVITIQLEIENENTKKYSFTPKQTPIKIGRINCDILIAKRSISKVHSLINYQDDNFNYKDCGSTNGSTLIIREDDNIKIEGEMNFKLEDASFKIREIEGS